MKAHDLTGIVFGELTALERAPNDTSGAAKWVCQCSCGGKVEARAANLLAGSTKTCGHCRAIRAGRIAAGEILTNPKGKRTYTSKHADDPAHVAQHHEYRITSFTTRLRTGMSVDSMYGFYVIHDPKGKEICVSQLFTAKRKSRGVTSSHEARALHHLKRTGMIDGPRHYEHDRRWLGRIGVDLNPLTRTDTKEIDALWGQRRMDGLPCPASSYEAIAMIDAVAAKLGKARGSQAITPSSDLTDDDLLDARKLLEGKPTPAQRTQTLAQSVTDDEPNPLDDHVDDEEYIDLPPPENPEEWALRPAGQTVAATTCPIEPAPVPLTNHDLGCPGDYTPVEPRAHAGAMSPDNHTVVKSAPVQTVQTQDDDDDCWAG